MNLVVKVTAMKKMMTVMMMMRMMVMMVMMRYYLHGALMSDSDQNENITLNFNILKSLFQMLPIEKKSKKLDKKKARDKLVLFR